jgi:hypothetical protein
MERLHVISLTRLTRLTRLVRLVRETASKKCGEIGPGTSAQPSWV